MVIPHVILWSLYSSKRNASTTWCFFITIATQSRYKYKVEREQWSKKEAHMLLLYFKQVWMQISRASHCIDITRDNKINELLTLDKYILQLYNFHYSLLTVWRIDIPIGLLFRGLNIYEISECISKANCIVDFFHVKWAVNITLKVHSVNLHFINDLIDIGIRSYGLLV